MGANSVGAEANSPATSTSSYHGDDNEDDDDVNYDDDGDHKAQSSH